MKAKEFLELLVKHERTTTISKEEIEEPIDIKFNIEEQKTIVFDACIFKEDVFFQNVDLSCIFLFKACEFKKSVSFRNCEFKHTPFDHSEIEFSNTNVNGLYFAGYIEMKNGVKICNQSVVEKLVIDIRSLNKSTFKITNSQIIETFDVLNGNFATVEISEKTTISSKVRLHNLKLDDILIQDSTFEKDFHIYQIEVTSLLFYKSNFNDDIYLNNVCVRDILSISDSDFKKTFDVSSKSEWNQGTKNINSIHISSSKFGKQFIFNGNNSEIDDLTIVFSRQLEGEIYFTGYYLLKTNISGDNYNGNLIFDHCRFNHLCISSFNNYSTLSIISSEAFKENSILLINSSNLGKAHLYNISLNTFRRIMIDNSILTEILVANVKWFTPEKLNSVVSKRESDFKQKKEIYRQLKYALEKQGDKIESLTFKALEMSFFKEELFASKNLYSRIFGVDRFILFLGQTNSFGLNWIKPLILALLLTFVFYLLMVVQISGNLSWKLNIGIDSLKITLFEFKRYAYVFPQLLNPIHSLKDIFPTQVESFRIQALDYTLKLLLSFFIFQIISAFSGRAG